jgi:flagellar biosynthesis/type III secretory pathway protein FliH
VELLLYDAGEPPLDPEAIRQEGFRAGQDAAEESFNARIFELREEQQHLYETVLQGLETKFEELTVEIEAQLPEIVNRLVARVVRGVEMTPGIIRAQIEALISETGTPGEELHIELCPEDFAMLVPEERKKIGGGKVQIVENQSLKEGDIQMRSRFGLIDATVDARLANVKRSLLGDS